MPDLSQRELERVASNGGPEAATAVLVARFRSGDLSSEMARLAALCGHETCLVLIDDPALRFCVECGDSDFDAGCWDEETDRYYCGTCGHGRTEFDSQDLWGPPWGLEALGKQVAKFGQRIFALAEWAAGMWGCQHPGKTIWHHHVTRLDGSLRALNDVESLKAARAWIDNPCKETHDLCLPYWGTVTSYAWAPISTICVERTTRGRPGDHVIPHWDGTKIVRPDLLGNDASGKDSHQQVQKRIRDTLIGWALR